MRKTRSNQKSTTRTKSQSSSLPKTRRNNAREASKHRSPPDESSLTPARTRHGQSSENEVAFPKGSYIAFVDPSDNLDNFKLGHLVEAFRDIDQEAIVDVFEESAPLTFKRVATKQSVFEYCIICDTKVTEEKGKKKNEVLVKINKQQCNKILKLMTGVVQKLQEEESEDDYDEEEEEEDEPQESSEEEKESPAQISKRRMVTVKKTDSKKKNEVASVERKNRSSTRVKAVQSQPNPKSQTKKGKASKTPAKGKRSKKQDEEMEDEEEEASKEEMIDTSKRASKKRGNTLSMTVPRIGQKRRRPSKSIESDQEEESFNEEGEGDSEASQAVKKRKIGQGKEKIVKQPKAKKPKKMPTEFKKGKWNPHIELVDVDKYKEGTDNNLYFDCCIRCNNKNIIRAAITSNMKLLKNGIEAKQKISSLTAYWSPEVQWTSVDYMVCNNHHDMLELMLHPKVTIPQYSTYEAERNKGYPSRVNNPGYLLDYVDSGMVSNMAYGTRVRKVQMSRGNRQGNNAFLEYQDNQERNPVNYLLNQNFQRKLFHSPNVTQETVRALYKLNPAIESQFQSFAYEAVRSGNRAISYEIIKAMVKYPNWGFNQLHADVLSEDAKLEKVLKQSVTKKANTNKNITPIHCASINPDASYLKQLLDVNPEYEVVDDDMRRPVHYAAACIGPEPLRLLIQSGAALNAVDNQKKNCLHVAAYTGRHENARIILESNPGLLNTKDKKSMTPLAYACKYGFVEVVKVFLDFKARVNAGQGPLRMTPLCWAAAYGHYELCEFLLDNKARVLGKDKYKRTPLTLAVRNGHTKIASLLLQRGSEWDHPDSSMNTPLHYAAAYGWLDCIDLLIKAGAEVNAQNSWKITPINIAMMKNHQGCVKRLLNEPNVDVNCKDEKGRTLLMLSLVILDDESNEFIKFLLKIGADPNMADLEGLTALHYAAKYDLRARLNQYDQLTRKAEYEKQVKIQKQVVQLLIDHNADLTLKNKQNKTPFAICLDNDNTPLLELLQNRVSLNKEPDLFFSFENKIFNIEYQKILKKLLENEEPLPETINTLDHQGLTPFLAFIRSFTANYNNYFQQIQYRVNQQLVLHGKQGIENRITNQDLFDPYASQDHFYTYNQDLSNDQKNEITKKIMQNIIFQPFIEFLKYFIKQGADPQATVQKLKRYRDEERKNKELFAQMQEEQVAHKTKEELEIRKRDEIIKERFKKGRALRKTLANPFNNIYGQINQDQSLNAVDKYETRDGQKVLRQYSSMGLQNAIHIILSYPEPTLFEFLLDLNVNPDLPDYDEVTPFNLLSKNNQILNMEPLQMALEKLISLDVRIDYPDIKGRTPFLNFYEHQNYLTAYRMLDFGANVNQMDNSGLFALKYALIRRSNDEIEKLLSKGANINQIDNKGRNLLHHAINMSSATADATFETEQFLLERGVEINLRDHKSRTPLHYAFVKIQDWKNNSQIDPIETVSSMCGQKGLELDVPDKWFKTPLHYASQRGASICATYLVGRGADMEKKDIYGNTPLGVGLLNGHYNYGIILIQRGASVFSRVFKENPEKIAQQWKREEALYKKKSKKGDSVEGDQEMEDIEVTTKESPKKRHLDLFNPNANVFADYHGEEVDDDDYDEEDSEDLHQENVFNQQNAFGMHVYNTSSAKAAKKSAYPAMSYNFGNFMPAQQQFGGLNYGQGLDNFNQQQLVQAEVEEEGVSMFKLAIRAGQQGLAYLMMENGYDLMHATQDAMDEKKFLLVLTLLQKVPSDEVIQQKNNKGQNLFHILSMNASSCSFDHLKRIYEGLLKRGLNCREQDNFKRTALHYAVISKARELVKMLLQSEEGYDPNLVDNEGHTPLSLCLRGKACQDIFYNQWQQLDNIFMSLVKHGANVNIVYPEDQYKPAFKEEEVDEQYTEDYKPKGPYMCTLLINVIRQETRFFDIMKHNIIGLMEHGAKLNVVDSDGRDPCDYAIMQNNEDLLKMLLDNAKSGNINKSCQDKAGKSAAHYVVNPIKFGSYENVNMLKLLHQHGFNLQLKDAEGKTPAYYASQQESGVLLKELTRLTKQGENHAQIQRAGSVILSANWPEQKVDFEADAETFMELAKEREEKEAIVQKKKIPVDSTGNFEASYEVYYENNKPWDIYLTKVDLKNGIYGEYVFYKMQLLYDTNRDLYVVFTRWGRIGEEGMNQRTPFNNLEEAKQDFKKIFKQKTANDFEDLDNFERQKKKYNLAKVNYITVDYKDYLAPFDFEKCPKSRLPKPLYDLFEEVSNVTMYQRAMDQFGLDKHVMPFSAVKKEVIMQAKQILMEIQEVINEDAELSKQGVKADYDKLTAIKEKLSELSSRYYEYIPLAQYKDQIAPPLQHAYAIKTQFDMLESLSYIEFASKMLLGALYKQKEMNPVDYVFDALNFFIEPLSKESPEFEVINTYISNTRNENDYQNVNFEIANIFKIQRKGEAEMIQAYKDVPNHFLLYHGSMMQNFIGILKQGLRIAPPEAPPTGYMFGKGVYFADMFDKSANYSQRGYAQQDSYLMLMCEVALGKSKELQQPEYIENLEDPYLSVKGVGRNGPDYKNTIVLPNGVKIPYGKITDYFKGDLNYNRAMLQHNEYIVYNTSQIRMRYLIQIRRKTQEKKR